MRKQIVMITGAAGFIGYNLVRHLIANTEYHLHLVESNHCKPQQMERLRNLRFNDRVTLQFVNPHGTNWPRPPQLCADQDPDMVNMAGVVHLGAECHTRAAETPRLWATNTELSLKIIETFRDYCPVLFASTAAIYSGTCYKNTVLHENMAINENMLSPYAWTKYAVERGALKMTRERNSRYPVFGLRFFNVYGEYEQHKGDMISFPGNIWNQLCETGEAIVYDSSELFPGVENARDFVHVQDCVELMVKLLDMSTDLETSIMPLAGMNYRTLNVGSGLAMKLVDAAHVVAEEYERRTGLTATIRIKPMPEHWRKTYQPYTCASTGLIRRANINFRSLHQSIKEFRAWDGLVAKVQEQT